MKKKVVLCLRERRGIGDVLCTFPAVRALSEKYRVVYATERDMTYWAEQCPYIDTIIPIPASILCYDHSPFREENYVENLCRITRGKLLPEDIDKIVMFFCPSTQLERVYTIYKMKRPLNRLETMWCAAGLKLEDLPINPMPGCIKIPKTTEFVQSILDGGPYMLIQAHSDGDNYRKTPEDLVVKEVEHDFAIHGVCRAVVVGTLEHKMLYYEKKLSAILLQRLPFLDLLSLVYNAEKIYSPDSFAVHLAAAYEVPSVSWFCTTDGQVVTRRYPLAEYRQADCYPCENNTCLMEIVRPECFEKQRCHAEWT